VNTLESKSLVELSVFESKARIEIVKLLLQFEIMSLSEIRKRLKETYERAITLPGLLRHMHELERVGIVNQESGGFLPVPDARRRVYIIQGKDRVKDILQSWDILSRKLGAGLAFSNLARTARQVFASGVLPQTKERLMLEKLIEVCESSQVACHLMDDEKKKIAFWKMMLSTTLQF
jgi:hypothetical protein